ncbi:retrovirus-related pol polyprotein from transposon TNT 1-94 [Tanacetum coccineum]
MKIEESLNVTFDETLPPFKTSPLVDDDLDEEEAIKVTKKRNLENDTKDEILEIDEIVNIKESRNHPIENVIGNLNPRTLRLQAQNQSNFFCFISTIEPKNVNEALTDESWLIAMQEELNQFIVNDVWELVQQPKNMTIIGTKWVFRNKLDENGVVSRNKARILLAYACALDFNLFQMNVKSAFLNGFINEEVYVAQPPGFIDFEKSDHVYKLKKALYGLKQAPKAWIPSKGHCSYFDKWSLDYMEISSPTKGRYQTTPPSLSFIKTLIQTPRKGLITRVRNKKTIDVDDNEILNREIQHHMSSWVEIIRENVFCLGGHRDHVPACLCHMLYCIETSTKYNLAFFILKRMESIQNTPKAILPYGMILTRLFTHIMSNLPESSNDLYILCDRVMHPHAPHYERKTRSDHGTKRCRSSNPSSSSNFLDHPSSSHHIIENNDGNDEESFHSNTPSLT